jgi:hypothetical protein
MGGAGTPLPSIAPWRSAFHAPINVVWRRSAISVTKEHTAPVIRENAEGLPVGTVLVIKQKKNDDGSWTSTSYFFVFPKGSQRELSVADFKFGQYTLKAG